MNLMNIFTIAISALLVNNFVLSKFLGICSFLGVSTDTKTATGMGAAVTFVMVLASLMSWLIYTFILVPFNITYLYTIAFILVIAALVQFVEMFMKKYTLSLYKALGIYLPLITTNCAILGAVVINMNESYTLIESLAFGLFSGLGYLIAILLLAGIRERFENNTNTPIYMKGLPISLITAGLMSIAFLGFQGLI